MDGGRRRRDDAGARRGDVGDREFGAHGESRVPPVDGARVDLRGEGRGGLGERGGGAAVEDPGRLGVPLDGHGDDGPGGGVLEHLHAHRLHEGAGPMGADEPPIDGGIGAGR